MNINSLTSLLNSFKHVEYIIKQTGNVFASTINKSERTIGEIIWKIIIYNCACFFFFDYFFSYMKIKNLVK